MLSEEASLLSVHLHLGEPEAPLSSIQHNFTTVNYLFFDFAAVLLLN